MDKRPYIDNDHLAPPPTISPALAATGAPRAASTGRAHRLPQLRIITTAAKSLLPPLCTRRCLNGGSDPPASQRTYRACDPRHCCIDTVVRGAPLVVHVAEAVRGGARWVE
jgi:hypothetical protein